MTTIETRQATATVCVSCDGSSDGQNPANPPEPPAWSPPEALAMIIPASLLIWAHDGEPTMNSAVAAIVRAATYSPAKTNCEKALREAGVLPSQEEPGSTATATRTSARFCCWTRRQCSGSSQVQ